MLPRKRSPQKPTKKAKTKSVKQSVEKPTRRLSMEQAPTPGNHVLFLSAGAVGPELTTLHTARLPPTTVTILQAKAQRSGFYVLQDHTSETVELYRSFLYYGNIYSKTDNDVDYEDTGDDAVHEDREWVRLAHAYILGAEPKDEKFANAVIDALIDKVEHSERYPTGLATELYARTPPGDRLRALIVDFHVWIGKHIIYPHDDADGPAAFRSDVFRGLEAVGVTEFEAPWTVNACRYHVHAETQRCRSVV